MKHSIAMLLISVLGIAGILYTTIINADVSGYKDVHSCWGECYEEYTKTHGTFLEQLEAKELQCNRKHLLIKVRRYMLTVTCVMVFGPKLVGSTSIVNMLMQYKNGETRGEQSALMWGQAANLSTEDMENLQAYINTFN